MQSVRDIYQFLTLLPFCVVHNNCSNSNIASQNLKKAALVIVQKQVTLDACRSVLLALYRLLSVHRTVVTTLRIHSQQFLLWNQVSAKKQSAGRPWAKKIYSYDKLNTVLQSPMIKEVQANIAPKITAARAKKRGTYSFSLYKEQPITITCSD